MSCRVLSLPANLDYTGAIMSDEQKETAILPEVAKPHLAPLWHVVLVDDDDHSYDYVIEMLGKLFHHDL